MTTPNDPGSIRDRLSAPAPNPEANRGGDSRESEISDSSFQQTDSRGQLQAEGRSERQESHHAGVQPEGVHHLHEPLNEAEQKAAERKISGLFLLSLLGVIGFVIAYVVGEADFGDEGYAWFTPLLGFFMAVALGGIGAGAVLWAKTIMVDDLSVQERHSFASDPDERAATATALKQGLQDTGLPRRPLLIGTMALGAGALALLPIPFLFGMGRFQHKERALRNTAWRDGMRLMREDGTAVRVGDLQIGGVESVFPDVPNSVHVADSPALLIRMRPEELHPVEGREDWSYEGHIVYSSICTHMGCPVKLYEQQTHYMLCPCHQSTFDASRGAEVIFGPAARALPQLAISVDEDGYFIAQGDFPEPIGPSFWERDSA